MSDRYSQLINSPVGKMVAGNVGLPVPTKLDRYHPGDPVARGPVLVGGAPGGRLLGDIARVLADARAEAVSELREDIRSALAGTDLDAAVFNPESGSDDAMFNALVFDATGISSSEELSALREFFGPTIRRVSRSGRVVVLATPPGDCAEGREAIAQRALEGFTRAVGKELRHGATSQLVSVAPGAEKLIDSTLEFLLSARSAYVSGQVIRVTGAEPFAGDIDWDRPQDGRVALVTGAARGIGAAIAEVLARDGAHVVGLDVPEAEDALEKGMGRIGGSSLALDITAAEAPSAIVDYLKSEHGRLDVMIHNAGITRDKTLGRMDADRWDLLMAVNLTAPERITKALLDDSALLTDQGRVIGVSSISGIAGNAGQTNYSTSKAGVIGFVDAMAPTLAQRGGTINAVAPGFIETAMTDAMPLAPREVGRRLNSLSQGGQPVDVAEAIAWFASPASGGVNGNVVRVCGQSLLGA